MIPIYTYVFAYLIINIILSVCGIWFDFDRGFTYAILGLNAAVLIVIGYMVVGDIVKVRKQRKNVKELERLGGLKTVLKYQSMGLKAWDINGGVVWAATKRAAKRKAERKANGSV